MQCVRKVRLLLLGHLLAETPPFALLTGGSLGLPAWRASSVQPWCAGGRGSDSCPCLCFAGDFDFADINSLNLSGKWESTMGWLEGGWHLLMCESGPCLSVAVWPLVGICPSLMKLWIFCVETGTQVLSFRET